jgi:hypothetical protein
MSWNKVVPAVRQLGYCCVWAYLRTNTELPTTEVAAELGVDTRTIRYLRKRSHQCERRPECLKAAAERLRKGGPAPDA